MKKKLLTLLIICLTLSISLFAITACGESETYNVTFSSGVTSDVTLEVDAGGKVTAPTKPVKDGYDFIGWYNGDSAWSFDNAVNSDMTLTAKFALTNYKLNYNLDGGSLATQNPSTYTMETPTFKLNKPTKDYYNFTGWTYDGHDLPSQNVYIEKGSKGNKSFKANYAPIEYTITYNYGDSVAPFNPTTYNIETETFTLKNPVKANCDFIGWTYAGQDTPKLVVDVVNGTTGNLEFTANFMENFDIEYVLDGGTVVGNPISYTPVTPAFTLNNPTKKDFVFVGWTYAGQDTPIKNLTIEPGTTGNLVFTAHYEKALIVESGVLTAIHEDAKSLETINITSDVTSISGNVFDGCTAVKNFTSESTAFKVVDGNLYSADGTTIIKYAVAKTTTSLDLPSTVTTIGEYAFIGASNLAELELGSQVVNVSGSPFTGCSNLVITITSRTEALTWSTTWDTGVKDVIVIDDSDVEIEF